MDLIQNKEKARFLIQEAEALLITAGAGIGVDSGLPDFRGNEGFWKAYPPIAKLGISFSEMANPYWFEKKPELAWAFYGHRLNLYRDTQPHEGFTKLLEFGESLPKGYFVFTSNVDGQFQKAGFDPEKIEEVHGSIHHFQCFQPCSNQIWDASKEEIHVDMDSFEAEKPLPSCPHCGGLARPNILMFGDWSWLHNRSAEQGNRLQNWLHNLYITNSRLVIIELGAGQSVPTVRFKSERVAEQNNATLIRINPRDYQVPNGHYYIAKGASDGINFIL